MPNVAGMLENTRTIRTNAFMYWMGWNIQYHTAHHTFPGVPFYRLKQLHHELFTARGIEPATMTYLGFQWAALKSLWEKGEAERDNSRQWIPAPAAQQSPVTSEVRA